LRIGLISDTHGIVEPAFRALDLMGSLDLLVHAGDHYHDASAIAARVDFPVHAVVGNCDSRLEGPEEKILELDGMRIYITHGHKYNVKISLLRLYHRAVEVRAAVAVYGHTHVSGYCHTPYEGCPDSGGLLLINPGSVSKPRNGDKYSFGLLEITDGLIKPSIMNL
jgi:putative phosphoesterase